MQRRFKLSSRNKFTTLFVLLILVPLILLNIFLLVVQFEQTTSDYLTTQKYAFMDVSDNLSDDLEEAFSYATTVSQDYDLYVFLNKTYTSYQDFYNNYDGYGVAKLFSMSAVENIRISDPVLYTTNQSIYTTPVTVQISESTTEESWYQAYDETNPNPQIYFDSETKYAYIMTKLIEFGTSDYTQFVMVRVDLDYVSNSLESVGMPCVAMLYSDSGSLLYSWDEGHEMKGTAESYAIVSSDGVYEDNAIVYTQNIDSYGTLKLVITLPNTQYFTMETLLPTVATLILTLLCSFFFMKNIQKDYIDRIENIVESLNVEELIAGNKQTVDSQLGFVEDTISQMSERITELLKTSFELEMARNQAEIRRKQSELNSLLSQINPHYLFNVLNAIRLKSLLKGEKETAKIILYVSKILRGSITWTQDVIDLSEELSFITEYLAIEKYRFEDKLEYKITSDEASLGCQIPKMCLQPFVENACVHGIQNILDTGEIHIDTAVVEGKLHITISNPVASFSREIKNQIINYSKGDFEVDTKSVGLKNTFGRLRYYYDDVNFSIDTSVENYVTMKLILSQTVDHTVDKNQVKSESEKENL